MVQALWNSMELPQKLKIELLHDPAIPLLGIYQKELKTRSQKDICALIFIIAKRRKQYKCPWVTKWMKNTHTHTMKYYLA